MPLLTLHLVIVHQLRQANALEVRKTCGMLEHVCSALYGLRSFHHQAHDMLDVLHGSARSLQAGIQTAQTRATELQDVWIDHRRKLAVALDEAKDLDEIHDVVEQLAKDLLGAQYHTAVALMADDSKVITPPAFAPRRLSTRPVTPPPVEPVQEGSNLSLSRVLSSPSADFVANADVLRGKGGDGDSDDDDEGPRTPKIAAAAGPPTPAAGLDATGGSSDTAPSGTAAPSHASVSAPVLMSGYLAKKSSGVRKDWKRRWFFVQDGRLWYGPRVCPFLRSSHTLLLTGISAAWVAKPRSSVSLSCATFASVQNLNCALPSRYVSTGAPVTTAEMVVERSSGNPTDVCICSWRTARRIARSGWIACGNASSPS